MQEQKTKINATRNNEATRQRSTPKTIEMESINNKQTNKGNKQKTNPKNKQTMQIM